MSENRRATIWLSLILILSQVLVASLWFRQKQVYDSQSTRINSLETNVRELQDSLGLVKTENEVLKNQKEQAENDKNYLIEQLGQRDEHIRSLLSKMLHIMTGETPVNLGKVAIGELQKKAAQWSPDARALAQSPAITRIGGSPQTAIETASLPAAPERASVRTQLAEIPSVVPMPAQGPEAKQIMGTLTAVDTELNFVILNRGKNHGVSAGQRFGVYHKGKPRGIVRVDTAHQFFSSANVVEGEASSFSADDMVMSI